MTPPDPPLAAAPRFCRDCRHARWLDSQPWECMRKRRTATSLDLVTGETHTAMSCSLVREERKYERPGYCGAEAKFFEPREPDDPA